ncbi:MAG: PKD domain-containing protein [Bacteroidetes bacterium OLB11]|nr:MAG: PKD domain-containing protein [Bacteroidetes bacterium OLB11]
MKKIFILFTVVLSIFLSHTLMAHSPQTGNNPTVEYIPNLGQWDAPFLYKSNHAPCDFFLTKTGYRVLLSDPANAQKMDRKHHGHIQSDGVLKFHAYDVSFVNSNPKVALSEEKILPHYYNYYQGNESRRWKQGVHPSLVVNYSNIYEGIDMRVYSENMNIKYDLIVGANADYKKIQIKYTGLDKIYIKDNKLILESSLGEQNELQPYTYQFINNEKIEIPCEYVVNGDIVSFKLKKNHNPAYPLYIDPTLVFSTLSASTADNWGFTATYDSSGNLYAGGITGYSYPNPGAYNGNFPTTPGAFQQNFGGGGPGGMGNIFRYDATVTKFNATGTSLIYSTYLGGVDNDQPQSMIVDHNDNLIVVGRTYSADFPTSPGCYDDSHNGGADIFVFKFSSAGAMLASTFVGGSGDDAVNVSPDEMVITPNDLKHNYSDDARSEVIVDSNNNIYLVAATTSPDFPTILAHQPNLGGMQDGVIVELNPNCTNLLWGTYLGGSQNDAAYVIALNKTNQNEVYVAGGTLSSNFPTTPGTLNPTYQGSIDGFLSRFNNSSKALVASTYIGTNAYDQVYGVQTDDSNRVYIVGQTQGAYPVTGGVWTIPNSSQFFSIINNSLSSIIHSTVFGTGTLATTNIAPNAFMIDKCQNVYLSGWGGPVIPANPGSTNGMPVTPDAIKLTTDGSDFYFIVLGKNLATFLYGSFFGQNGGVGEHVDGGTSRFDEKGVIYQAICAACGGSQTYPTTPGVWGPNNLSQNCNLGALKIAFNFQNPNAIASASGPLKGCAPLTIQFQNTSTSATNYSWNFGDGSPIDNSVNPTHTYSTPGVYTLTLVASNPNGCTATIDSMHLIITVINDSLKPNFTYVKQDSCGPFTAHFTNTSQYNNGMPMANADYHWDFGDGTSYNGQTPPLHSFPAANVYTVTLTMTDTNACNSPAVFQLVIDFATNIVKSAFVMPDSVCMPALVSFVDQSQNATGWSWNFGDGNTSNQTNPLNTYQTPGTFTVTLISFNPNTCNKLDSMSRIITIFPQPFADFSWKPDPPEPNTPNTFKNLSTGATDYLWDFGDGNTSTDKDPIHIYEKDGTYTVCLTARNSYGCKDTACKSVRGMVIPLVDVPTGFSPNGDGVNDYVYVKGYGIEKMMFRIFNRWGEKVFETTDKAIGWDGRYKGMMQEMEVYSYTLSVEFFDGSKLNKSGNITLLK